MYIRRLSAHINEMLGSNLRKARVIKVSKHKKKLTIEEVYAGSNYIIDDSMMPSAEEMKKMPQTPPEIREKIIESALEFARDMLRERGEKVDF